MPCYRLCFIFLSACLCLPNAHADAGLAMPTISASELKVAADEPYVVQKGDTLWDIANHFFRDPHKWLHIWEQNLYISNPDLIYPGNIIRFNVQEKATGGLDIEHLQPQVHIKPYVDKQPVWHASLAIRQAFKQYRLSSSNDPKRLGRIITGSENRHHYAQTDTLYIHLKQALERGQKLAVYHQVYLLDAEQDRQLLEHIATIQITDRQANLSKANILSLSRELSIGDIIMPISQDSIHFQKHFGRQASTGRILYIKDEQSLSSAQKLILVQGSAALEAGQQAIIMRPASPPEEQPALPAYQVASGFVLKVEQGIAFVWLAQSTEAVHPHDQIIFPSQP